MALRIGILGAAPIARAAIIRPSRALAEVDVVAVAARDQERARRFARGHGIRRVHETYAAVLADPACTGDWDVALAEAGVPFRDEAYGFVYLGVT